MTYFSFPFRWIMLRFNESRGVPDERIFSLPAPLDSNILLGTWTEEIQTFHLEQCKCFFKYIKKVHSFLTLGVNL